MPVVPGAVHDALLLVGWGLPHHESSWSWQRWGKPHPSNRRHALPVAVVSAAAARIGVIGRHRIILAALAARGLGVVPLAESFRLDPGLALDIRLDQLGRPLLGAQDHA